MTNYELAAKYGKEMELYGKSLYWSSPRQCPDTTSKLLKDPDFLALSKADRETILQYGTQCKRFGMGCYQDHGPNANLYHQYYGRGGMPNPFSIISKNITGRQSSNVDSL